MSTYDSNGKKIIEQRTCVGCRKSQHKSLMIRVVKTLAGEIKVDRTGKLQGRGAYLCKNPDCLKKALKKHQFERAFKTKAAAAVYDIINSELRMQNAE